MDASGGSGEAEGTLQPGTYVLNGSAEPHGNTDPSNPGFQAHADFGGTVTLTC
jgi:hypothetical protein